MIPVEEISSWKEVITNFLHSARKPTQAKISSNEIVRDLHDLVTTVACVLQVELSHHDVVTLVQFGEQPFITLVGLLRFMNAKADRHFVLGDRQYLDVALVPGNAGWAFADAVIGFPFYVVNRNPHVVPVWSVSEILRDMPLIVADDDGEHITLCPFANEPAPRPAEVSFVEPGVFGELTLDFLEPNHQSDEVNLERAYRACVVHAHVESSLDDEDPW